MSHEMMVKKEKQSLLFSVHSSCYKLNTEVVYFSLVI